MDSIFDFVLKQIPLNVLTLLGILAVLIIELKWTLPELKRLTSEVSKTNGSVQRLNIWQSGHEKQDDERHEENTENLRDIKAELRDLGKEQRRQ